MRIISQNGEVNLPFEITSICTNDGVIRASVSGSDSTSYVMAIYSTKDKAINVMCDINTWWRAGIKIFKFQEDSEV